MPGIDWRHDTLDRIRVLIQETDTDVSEDAKWAKASNPAGVPTWSHDGIICTGEIYKDKVKVTFMHGASLDDPDRLFNDSLDAGTRRAINIVEGSKLDEPTFKALIRAAVDLNVGRAAAKRRK
jgi:hypothetical protein